VPLEGPSFFLEPSDGLHDYTVNTQIFIAIANPQSQVGRVNEVLGQICKKLDQKSLLPARNDELTVRRLDTSQMEMQWQGGVKCVLPMKDCMLLPTASTSAPQDLAEYIATEVVKHLELGDGMVEVKLTQVSRASKHSASGCFSVRMEADEFATKSPPSTASEEEEEESQLTPPSIPSAPSSQRLAAMWEKMPFGSCCPRWALRNPHVMS